MATELCNNSPDMQPLKISLRFFLEISISFVTEIVNYVEALILL